MCHNQPWSGDTWSCIWFKAGAQRSQLSLTQEVPTSMVMGGGVLWPMASWLLSDKEGNSGRFPPLFCGCQPKEPSEHSFYYPASFQVTCHWDRVRDFDGVCDIEGLCPARLGQHELLQFIPELVIISTVQSLVLGVLGRPLLACCLPCLCRDSFLSSSSAKSVPCDSCGCSCVDVVLVMLRPTTCFWLLDILQLVLDGHRELVTGSASFSSSSYIYQHHVCWWRSRAIWCLLFMKEVVLPSPCLLAHDHCIDVAGVLLIFIYLCKKDAPNNGMILQVVCRWPHSPIRMHHTHAIT